MLGIRKRLKILAPATGTACLPEIPCNFDLLSKTTLWDRLELSQDGGRYHTRTITAQLCIPLDLCLNLNPMSASP